MSNDPAIKGYRPLSAETRAIVDGNKLLEELLLRQCDGLAIRNAEDQSIDFRWHAIAVSHFQQGFMALNRAIMQPQRLTDMSTEELKDTILRGAEVGEKSVNEEKSDEA